MIPDFDEFLQAAEESDYKFLEGSGVSKAFLVQLSPENIGPFLQEYAKLLIQTNTDITIRYLRAYHEWLQKHL